MTTKKKKKEILYSFDTQELLHTHRQIFLHGVITDAVANVIKQKMVAFDIVSHRPITLWLSSPGGSCPAGLSIIEVMTHISSPVITIISGEVASMAAMISICGDVKWGFSGTGGWMQHPLSSGQADYFPFIKDRTAYLVRYNEILTKIMKDNTKLTDEDYQKIEHGELWLLDKELVEKGIVDKLL